MAKSANLYARIEPDLKEQARAENTVTVMRVMYGGRDVDRRLGEEGAGE